MDEQAVRDWTDRYVKAWGSNDPEDIGSLFTDDATYLTAPWREPWRGRQGIVEGWLDRKDAPGDWEFDYHVVAVADDLGFVEGVTQYKAEDDQSRYSNFWIIRLAEDGKASEFTEWWMLQT